MKSDKNIKSLCIKEILEWTILQPFKNPMSPICWLQGPLV